MKQVTLTLILTFFFITHAFAQQFSISAEIRPRYEGRNGYRSLLNKGDVGAHFISQRTRMNLIYKSEKINMKIALQNVRTWGDVSTLASDDRAIAFHEAWAEAVFFSGKLSLRLGRQEIIYDDHRIFGNVGWAQQARSHDAILLKFMPAENHKIEVGLAINSDGQQDTEKNYSNAAGYKVFQYAWYHGKFDKLKVSFLFLNTGVERDAPSLTLDYMQTIGPRLVYTQGRFSANVATYLQVGQYKEKNVSTALDFTVNMAYKISDNLNVGLGYEHLSGKGTNDTSDEIKSFAPLFGTNHKFNGLMDYFYVGNYSQSVGLNDIYATVAYKKDKFSAKLVPHMFFTAADVYRSSDKMKSNLGTEIDVVVGYKILETLSINAGFSSMLATETMEVVKGGSRDLDNNWIWLMATFKPTLFSSTRKK